MGWDTSNRQRFFGIAMVVWLLLAVLANAGLVYVVLHFVMKYW